MDISAIALRGLDQAQSKLETAASRLAPAGAFSSTGTPFDSVDLSQEAVALLSARNEFATNIKLLHTADDLAQWAIDLLA